MNVTSADHGPHSVLALFRAHAGRHRNGDDTTVLTTLLPHQPSPTTPAAKDTVHRPD